MKFLVQFLVLVLCLFTTTPRLSAAAIAKLFNSGVNDAGTLLGPDETDPHYQLTASADPTAPGPSVFTLVPGFPVGPWIEEGPLSRWIAPQGNQSSGNEPGTYTFTTTFDLTGMNPATAQISGRMSADNSVTGVRLNGSDLGVTAGGFNVWTPFAIPVGSPFAAGTNTLEFDVSNAGDTINPAGFRVEMTGRVTGSGDAPAIIVQPQSQTVIVGDVATFTVDADGTAPLNYQWRFQGNPINGATQPNYTLTGITTNQAGDYSVSISNAIGATISTNARLTVWVPFPGIYNTGLTDNRQLIADGATDPHYRLALNPNDPGTVTTVVEDSTVFPIVAGPWVPNTVKSKWIGPLPETSAAAAGDYRYQLPLNLTGYDPQTAILAGSWATDDGGSLYLNGADTGFRSPGFTSFSTFTLTNGFVSGTNILEFRLNNGAVGYTGLRVEQLRGRADTQIGTVSSPRVVTQPRSATRVITDALTLTVVADGTQPLSYQWLQNGTPLPGETNAALVLPRILAANAGSYTVRVSNSVGTTNSEAAVLTVIEPLLGVVNTGVDAAGNLLDLRQPDPHYVLMASPDATHSGPTTYAPASAPIPPWVANGPVSQWIGPRADATEAAPGTYHYRLIFSLAASDIATAAITASVATDDGNLGIRLNGTPVDFGPSGFTAYSNLEIPAGAPFVAGLNTLDFFISNGGTSANPTGLRVDDIVLSGATVLPTLQISRVAGNIRIAWPLAPAGFQLQETPGLPGGWTATTATVNTQGNENVALIPLSSRPMFYRLAK